MILNRRLGTMLGRRLPLQVLLTWLVGAVGSRLVCISSMLSSRIGPLPETLDLSRAVVVTPASLSGPEKKAVTLLVEDVTRRAGVRWEVVHQWPGGKSAGAVVAVGPVSALNDFAGPFAASLGAAGQPKRPEGFRIRAEASGPAVLVIGNDARGVLFGVGRLLRELRTTEGRVSLPSTFQVATSPRYPLRGHQLGYRPKTNSYDAWDLAQWERYIRDLAIFGTNAVELIPPRSDDDADSPHFPLPPVDMMVGMSRLLDEYGLDVWIWYPAMDRELRRSGDGGRGAQGVGRRLPQAAARRRGVRARR